MINKIHLGDGTAFVGFEIDEIYHTDSISGLCEVDGRVGLFE